MHTELAESTIVDQRYTIVKLLGSGRSGMVYSARDSQLARNVALKVLNKALLQDSAFATRFVREARVLASIDHKNIMRCFDLVVESEAGAYLVTELVNGKNLFELIKQQGRLNLDDALEIVIQTLDGAEELRLKQLVHRDIKPSNIMIDWTDNAKTVKIIDFGLVGFGTAVGDLGDLKVTKPDMLLGTPPYMSPEQIRGQELDHRSDIFSIGCMLYKLITDETPISGETSFETMVQQLTRNPKPLSSFVKILPEGLQEVVSKALAKDRDQRYATATQFKEALSEIKGRLSLKAVDQSVCRICGRSRKSSVSNASITGWIFSCACHVSAPDALPPNCADCGKTIVDRTTGTLTQWLFKSNRCSCDFPRPKVLPMSLSEPDHQIESSEELSNDQSMVPEDVAITSSKPPYVLLALAMVILVGVSCLALLVTGEKQEAPKTPKTAITLDSPKGDSVGMLLNNYEVIPLHIFVDKDGLWETQGIELNNADLVSIKEQVEAFAPMKAARKANKVLRGRLKLNKCLISGNGGLEVLKDLNLVRLELSNTYVDDSAIDTLSQFPLLRDLSIRKVDNLTERVGEKLIKLEQLHTLRISGRGITHNTVADICKIPLLDELEIGEFTVSKQDIENFKKCNNLQIVGFEQCQIDSDVYPQLASMKHLKELRIIETKVANKEIDGLAKLKNLTKLTFILCPGLTEQMFQNLRKQLPNTQLVNHDKTLASTM
ncbi:MAG: serine/threonine protein kinase [Candidatus Obscuribacterales bacterium]|nr:serine/threonine protein kinase [Candidatus Obscuribacterales bacterium]